MVNVSTSDQKNHILKILRECNSARTGNAMGEELGISKVAVHKHIKGLKENGYEIESTHHGYRLVDTGSKHFTSWEFAPVEKIIILEETDSTMDEAHRLAARHPGENFTLAAERQSGGRGRRGRRWDSPSGGLWATRIIHPDGSSLYQQRYIMAAARALSSLLRNSYEIHTQVKWPNDILVNGKKIAGILGEARLSGDRITYLALGLGLNVNNQIGPGAAALKDVSGREEDRRQLLRNWLSETDEILNSEEFTRRKRPEKWNSLMRGVGEEAEYRVGGKRLAGTVLGADSLGRLVLREKTGKKIRIPPGDIDTAGKEININ